MPTRRRLQPAQGRTPTRGSISPSSGPGKQARPTPGPGLIAPAQGRSLPAMRPRTGRAPRGAAIVLLKRLIMANEFQLAVTAS